MGNAAPGAETGGVTVIDAARFEKVASIPTGRGHHEIAFSDGDRHAFVSNRDGGTVSVIDVAKLEKVKDIPTGPLPIAMAFSPTMSLGRPGMCTSPAEIIVVTPP